jgi:hypothetical protein
MMDRDQFAEYMNVNKRTIDTWIARGKFRESSRVKFHGKNFFRVADCLADLGFTVEEWEDLRKRG